MQGDVLLGSFLGGITKGLDFETSLALANEIAAKSVTGYGTSHLNQIRMPLMIDKLKSQIKRAEKSVSLEDFKI